MSQVPSSLRHAERYSVAAESFGEHLSLIRNDYQVFPLGQFWGGSAGSEKPSVVITFDDGCDSDYRFAFSMLQSAGATASFFVNTSNIGRPGYLNWGQIREMQHFGMSFQSHSHDHVYLTRLSSHEVVVQLTRSKLILQDRLGQSVDFLAAPYGDLNQGVLTAASEAGYHAVCSSHNWPALQGSRVIPRVALYRKTALAGFLHLLE